MKSFNTQPREGGCEAVFREACAGSPVSTHSRAKAAACLISVKHSGIAGFQHTAARRRLPARTTTPSVKDPVSTHSRAKAAAQAIGDGKIKTPVSTHSRAKAAAYFIDSLFGVSQCFNTQPREGGCNRL